MDNDKRIIANFRAVSEINYYQINLIENNASAGSISISGTYNYSPNTHVFATPYPKLNNAFINWSGDVPTGKENTVPLDIVVDRNKNIIANFKSVGTDNLNISSFKLDLSFSGSGALSMSTGNYYFQNWTNVTIRVISPSIGYRFIKWIGNVSESQKDLIEINIIMDKNKTIKANFTKLENWYALTVSSVNSFTGILEKFPNKPLYRVNETVTLIANPVYANLFANWTESGVILSENETLVVNMNRDRTLKGNFILAPDAYYLNLNPYSASNGILFSNLNLRSFYKNDKVVLTASPLKDYVFSHWTLDATGNENPLKLTMDRNKTVSAVFVLDTTPRFTLNLSLMPLNGGTLNPSVGLNEYREGNIVTITATPTITLNNRYFFKEWRNQTDSGAVLGTSNVLTIPITQNRTIIAVFELNQSSYCGNNITESQVEDCDDGNLIDGDGCASDCIIHNILSSTCGNSIVEAGEDCETGLSLGTECLANNYTGGNVSCGSNCRYDFSGCTGGTIGSIGNPDTGGNPSGGGSGGGGSGGSGGGGGASNGNVLNGTPIDNESYVPFGNESLDSGSSSSRDNENNSVDSSSILLNSLKKFFVKNWIWSVLVLAIIIVAVAIVLVILRGRRGKGRTNVSSYSSSNGEKKIKEIKELLDEGERMFSRGNITGAREKYVKVKKLYSVLNKVDSVLHSRIMAFYRNL